MNNAGGGGPIAWTATSNQPWLSVTPAGSSFTAFVASSGLAVGTHQASITVSAPGVANSPQTIAVTLTLAVPPSISLTPSTLTFDAVSGAANPASQTVTLSFSASASVAWTASDDASWLTVTPASGTGGAQLTATVNTSGLAPGTHTTAISASAFGTANSPQTVAVTLNLAPPPSIGLSATQLTFSAVAGGSAPANQTVDVSNTGGGTLSFTVSDDATWLTVSPTSGSAPATLAASVASGLAAGTYTGTITVAAVGAANSPRTIAVSVTVANPFNGTWIGKTSQDSTIRIEISNNAVTQIYLGWRVASCGTSGATTTNFTTPFSVASGSFSRSVTAPPASYTIAGNFTSATAVSGTLTINFSMSAPSSCSATVSNLTWSATKQ